MADPTPVTDGDLRRRLHEAISGSWSTMPTCWEAQIDAVLAALSVEDDMDLRDLIGPRLEAAQVRDADGVAALVVDVISPVVERLRAELAEVTEQRDIRRQDCEDLAEQSHERLQRALKAEAEVERLLKFTATCTCDTSYETYEGPQPGCPAHGAVRAYNEEQAESERLRAELAQAHNLSNIRAKLLREAWDAHHDTMGERDALKAELALHTDCRTDISIGDALRLIRAHHSPPDARSPVSTPTEAHGETGEAQEG